MIHRLIIAVLLCCAPATHSVQDELRPRESVVDYLKSTKRDFSLESRSGHWIRLFSSDAPKYRGSRVQNMRLLEALRVEDARGKDQLPPLPEACRIEADLKERTKGVEFLSVDQRPRDAQRDDSDGFFVVFSARDVNFSAPSPGHAWVTFGLVDGDEPKGCIARSFGNFPNDENKLTIGPVPGTLVEGWGKNLSSFDETHRLVVRVTDKQYLGARDVMENWTVRKEWRSIDKDCTTFAREVAVAIGLKVNDAVLPHVFLRRLIDENRPRPDKANGGGR